MNKKRVLCLTSYYATMGGLQNTADLINKGFLELGYEVTTISKEQPKLEVRNTTYFSVDPSLRELLHAIGSHDKVIIHGGYGNAEFALALKRKKVLCYHHHYWKPSSLKARLTQGIKAVIRKCSASRFVDAANSAYTPSKLGLSM